MLQSSGEYSQNEQTKSEKRKRRSNGAESLKCTRRTNARPMATDEYSQLKRIAHMKKKPVQWPQFSLKDRGKQALLSLPLRERRPLDISEIQATILHAAGGETCSASLESRWYCLTRASQISNVILMIVEGLGASDFTHIPEAFPSMKECIFPDYQQTATVCEPVGGSSYSAAGAWITLLVSPTFRRKMIKKYGNLEAASKAGEIFSLSSRSKWPMTPDSGSVTPPSKGERQTATLPRTRLVLSLEQQACEGYPLPCDPPIAEYADFKFSREVYSEVHSESPIFAVDCEMCLTKSGELELTRISIVDEWHTTIYSTFVLPKSPIVDYLTAYSGVTHEMLVGVETRLEDVQEYIRALLPPDAILAGHSLGSDLKALKLFHPYCVDTSFIYNLSSMRHIKPSLAALSHHFLNREIQTKGALGHDPTEDALAAMELVQRKLANGIYYGDAASVHELSDEEAENMWDADEVYAANMLQLMFSKKISVGLIAKEHTIASYQRLMNATSSHKPVFEPAENNVDLMVRMRMSAATNKLTILHTDVSRLDVGKACGRVDRWCRKAYDTLSQYGLLMVLMCGSDGSSDNRSERVKNDGCFMLRLKDNSYMNGHHNGY